MQAAHWQVLKNFARKNSEAF